MAIVNYHKLFLRTINVSLNIRIEYQKKSLIMYVILNIKFYLSYFKYPNLFRILMIRFIVLTLTYIFFIS